MVSFFRYGIVAAVVAAGSLTVEAQGSFERIDPVAAPGVNARYGGVLAKTDSIVYVWYATDDNGFEAGIFDGRSVRLVRNPDHSVEKLYGIFGSPVVYRGKLYFRYRTAANQYELGVLDGGVIRLFPNPTGADYYSMAPAVVYKDKLILQFRGGIPRGRVPARFNGTEVQLIPQATAGEYTGSPLVFKGRLYYAYLVNGAPFLGYTDGDNTDFVRGSEQNWDDGGPSFEFKGKLFLGVSQSGLIRDWGVYEGHGVTRIPIPDRLGLVSCPCTVTGDAVYFFYETGGNKFLAQTDGVTMRVIPNLAGQGFAGYGRTAPGSSHDNLFWNGKLYFPYSLPPADGGSQRRDGLALYDGSGERIVANGAEGEVFGDLILFGGSLYYNLDNRLVRFDGKTSSTVDAGSAAYYYGQPFEFKGDLYINYQGHLARFTARGL